MSPVFLTYQKGDAINEKMNEIVKIQKPYSEITSDDAVKHVVSNLDYKFYSCGKLIREKINSSKRSLRRLMLLM